MKRIIIVVVVVLVGILVSVSLKRPIKVLLKCSYMAYACGDCYPQFRVDSIMYSDRPIDDLTGKDVYLFIENRGTKTPLEEEIKNCWICYDYYVEGLLEKNWLNSKKQIIVTKYNLVMRNKDCCSSLN
jgi:hypothetical protein